MKRVRWKHGHKEPAPRKLQPVAAARLRGRRGLGRLHAHDERDFGFMLAAPSSDRAYRYWYDGGWWGDQGAAPQCVAYAWAHWIEGAQVTFPEPGSAVFPPTLYARAQEIDEWPGTDYDGTSVRAGVKALQEQGYVGAYRWAFDLETLLPSVLEEGPAVMGTNWYAGMSRPDAEGIIHADGALQGGHAWVVTGVNTGRGLARVKNSWGRSWGKQGRAWIPLEDLERLITEDGEACLPTAMRP